MKNLKEQIPLAIQAIKDYIADKSSKSSVDRKYNGYVSSLGAAINQAGLIPTLSFYSDTSKDQNNLLKAIMYVIDRNAALENATLLNYVLKKIDPKSRPQDINYDFSKFCQDQAASVTPEQRIAREKYITKIIEEAAVAIKLAIRTFKQEKS